MLRPLFHRTFVSATRPSAAPIARKVATKSTKLGNAASTTAPSTAEEIAPEEFFDPPEFGLQSGQSITSTSPLSTTTPRALKGKSISELFNSNLHDHPDKSPIPGEIHWPTSYYGLAIEPFPEKAQQVLAESIDPKDIEIKPDGLIYLPEIKYRRILNRAFGAGGWGLIPRSETIVTDKLLTREYALIVSGRLVSIARGEQDYFSVEGIPTATEGCRSNALMRTCKDLGVASELWDPSFIRAFKKEHCEEKFVEHVTTKRKRKLWKRKDRTFEYPYKVV